MATCKATKTVTTYRLELSDEEVRALMDVLEHIAGVPSSSPRMYTDAIRNALIDAGGEPGNYRFENGEHSLRFRDFD